MTDFVFPQHDDNDDARNFAASYRAIASKQGHSVQGHEPGFEIREGRTDLSSDVVDALGLDLNADGSKFFINSNDEKAIVEYSAENNFQTDGLTRANTADISAATSGSNEVKALEFNDDGTKLFFLNENYDTDTYFVESFTVSSGYDLGSTVSSNNSLDVTSDLNGAIHDMTFGDEGSKLIITDDSGELYQYNLSTAYDLSTASLDTTFVPSETDDFSLVNAFYNGDGSRIYVTTDSSDNQAFYIYDLSTNYDIGTASFNKTNAFMDTSAPQEEVRFSFADNGNRFYIIEGTFDAAFIHSAIVDTAYDLDTAHHYEVTAPYNEYNFAWFVSMAWGKSGQKLYLVENNGVIHEFNTAVPYDETNLTLNKTADISGNVSGEIFDIEWVNSGSRLIIGEDAETVHEFTAGTDFDIASLTHETSTNLLGARFDFGPDEKQMITANDFGSYFKINLGSSGDISTASPKSITTIPEENSDAQYTSMRWVNSGNKLIALDKTNSKLLQYSASTKYDPSTITLDKSLDISATSSLISPHGHSWNDDGTKFYVVSTNEAFVQSYSLSTAYDIGTASTLNTYDFSSQTTEARSVTFNNDGSKMFILGNNETLYEYGLSTAHDITTASLNNSFNDFDLGGANTINFNSDGTTMFAIDSDIEEYSLSTGFDVSTMSKTNTGSISPFDNYNDSYVMNSDGTEMYTVIESNENDSISKIQLAHFTLSTGFDSSTISAVGASSFSNSPISLDWNSDGSKVLIYGQNGEFWESSTSDYSVEKMSSFTQKGDLDRRSYFVDTYVLSNPELTKFTCITGNEWLFSTDLEELSVNTSNRSSGLASVKQGLSVVKEGSGVTHTNSENRSQGLIYAVESAEIGPVRFSNHINLNVYVNAFFDYDDVVSARIWGADRTPNDLSGKIADIDSNLNVSARKEIPFDNDVSAPGYKDSSNNVMMQNVVDSGTVSVTTGTAVVDTGVTDSSASFLVSFGVQDPNADTKVNYELFWDDSAGTHKVEFNENTSNNPTLNYTIIRVN